MLLSGLLTDEDHHLVCSVCDGLGADLAAAQEGATQAKEDLTAASYRHGAAVLLCSAACAGLTWTPVPRGVVRGAVATGALLWSGWSG